MRKTPTGVFFYGGIYSQWANTPIVEGDLTFSTAEHRMMYYKAKLFNDSKAMKDILKSNDPAKVKAIGRRVKNFDADKWSEASPTIVEQTNYLKILQHKAMMEECLVDAQREIVEASPYDKIWGIGLAVYDNDCLDKSKWQGLNELGRAIMRARDRVFTENNSKGSWLKESDIYGED